MIRVILVTTATAIGVGALLFLRLVGFLSHQALAAALFVGALWAVVSRLWLAARGRLYIEFPRELRSADARGHVWQMLGRGSFWGVVTAAAVAVFPIGDEVRSLVWVVVALGVVRLGAELLPARTVSRAPTIVMLLGALVIAYDLGRVLLPGAAPQLVIEPPFRGTWVVLQGGRSALQSHHLAAYNQHWALDLMRIEDGRLFVDGELGNAQWQSWEQPLVSPVDGEVVDARGDVADSVGLNLVADEEQAAGNFVVIETAEGLFVVLAHLREDSLSVAVGDRVAAGQRIGSCGNSGNTTSPHLHLQVQTHARLWDPRNRSVPFTFEGMSQSLARNDLVVGAP